MQHECKTNEHMTKQPNEHIIVKPHEQTNGTINDTTNEQTN